MNIDKFDALSIEELYELADRNGIDLPPGLERPFIVEEILDVLEEDSQERRESQGETLHVEEKKYSELRIDDIDVEPAEGDAIAARYNDTCIRAIVRDPSWAFAFWDISDADLEAARGEESSAGLFLRVAELDGAQGSAQANEQRCDYFDIPVADEDAKWYINLPRPGVRFRIDLCSRQSGRLRVLARSNEVQSPRQSIADSATALSRETRRLLALSRVEELGLEEAESENPLRILSAESPARAGNGSGASWAAQRAARG